MDLNTFSLLIALVAVILIRTRATSTYLPASANDWFVIFNVDAKKKQLTLCFYPIVGFRLKNDGITPITSCPSVTAKLAANRQPEKINDSMWGVSVSYGRWVRDDALLDESGNPEMTDSSTFSAIVERYLYGEFKLHYGTSIPVYYQQTIIGACERVKQEAEGST
jgi:hypothetical protein